MGIPAAFRWLSNKYPKIISPVIEQSPIITEDGITIPVDTTQPNPNGEELDNLYLDMNGIVHPCSHPEDRPAPSDEEEMMLEVFKYTDRVVNMVRPRKILMIAVDGVAPRAKMNQQRSRRFRSAQEAKEKEEDKQALIELLKRQNGGVFSAADSETVVKKAFDSNSITPGTPFMDILAMSLRYWCQYKLSTDPAWAKLKVIISDATVPGEGEHKIMNFIRSQRTSPNYDPNTRHVIYGLDADLIMLGLATHEPHFRVLREDVFFQEGKNRVCKLCGQKGHEAQNCRGNAKPNDNATDEKNKDIQSQSPIQKPFIWLHVSVLREYLAAELAVPDLPFRFDLERAIDDWIFMCCFVGNDFLPHLPALEIREHGIDTLTTIWRNNLPSMGGYVTKDGHIDLERAQVILDGLASQESAIFKRRKEQEDRREASAKRRKLQNDGYARNGQHGSSSRPNGHADPTKGLQLFPIVSQPTSSSHNITHDMVVSRGGASQDVTLANKGAASVMRDRLRADTNKDENASTAAASITQPLPSSLGKRKATASDDIANSSTESPQVKPLTPQEVEPIDNVRLWEDGYEDRYYQQKFHKDPQDIEFRHGVAQAYVEGLAWVLLYYFQGCPSWEWYYPYHYAPFAADFKNLSKMEIAFEKGRISRPFEQLMSVLPAASRHALPTVFHDLMTEKDSEIIDFYPEEFQVDLNGKKMAWQGIALLPFIDMSRLLKAVQSKYPLLSPEDTARNAVGKDVLLLSDSHEGLYDDILTTFYSKKQDRSKFNINTGHSNGLAGEIEKQEDKVPHGALRYPLERRSMPDLDYDRSISVYYDMPQISQTHKSMLLRGVRMPVPALTRSDIEVIRGKTNRTGRNYGGGPPPYGNNNGRHRFGNSGGFRDARESYAGRNRDNQRFEPHHSSYTMPQSGRWQAPTVPAFDPRASSSTATNMRHQQGWFDNRGEHNAPARRGEDFGARPPYGGGHWHRRDFT
ncbi:5 -3 exoribonuclease 2 [Trichoderma arundinaceum]|uniref:5'-3' exoribonuclease n=1 Tax=Trichoderma arundinaceum TaxID=490622 RepID=A0A395NJP8_TRIAR|nr:5 -3 exoribonuclease 2 [Trichoderma arundinaceum]